MANKIEYGLRNIYFAPLTATTSEAGVTTYTYGTPVRLPGAVSLTMDPQNGEYTFYADDTAYFTTNTNNGYSGEVTVAYITDAIKKAIFNCVESEDGTLLETDALPNDGALLFECQGDEHARRHVLYNCSFGRGSDEKNTQEESIEASTQSMTFVAGSIELADGRRVFKGTTSKDSAGYASFFTKVTVPTVAAGA